MMKKMFLSVMLFGLFSFTVCGASSVLSPPELGVEFRAPAKDIYPGDPFYLYVDINNPTDETYYGVPLFAIWSVDSDFNVAFFWPFNPGKPWIAGDVHYYTIDVPPGITEVEVVPPFLWTDSVGDNEATLHLFTGMSNPFFTKVFGTTNWLDILCHF